MKEENTIYHIYINKYDSWCDGFTFDLAKYEELWMYASRTIPYNAFKLYLYIAVYPQSELCNITAKQIHEELGISFTRSIDKAFNQLIDAGYIHRCGSITGENSKSEPVWEFFVSPMSESEYYSYIENSQSKSTITR